MLTYTDDNNKQGKSLKLLIHHDDCVREYCYDKGAENVLQRASQRNWTIVSMADDFEQIYPYEDGLKTEKQYYYERSSIATVNVYVKVYSCNHHR